MSASTKGERPQLAGVQVKTRKRNVAVPLDPASFADAVVEHFERVAKPDQSKQERLEAGVKALDASDLDFSRYADTLFEVLFAGGRMASGGNLADDNKRILDINVLASEPTKEDILPFVRAFHSLIRRRQFLVKGLENIECKLLQSLEFYDDNGRSKIAIATALCFSQKVGILPDKVLGVLCNDRLVAKGTVLNFITEFCKVFLEMTTFEELVGLLTRGKVANRLQDFAPPAKRTPAALHQHFADAGLTALVDWQQKKTVEGKMQELNSGLSSMIKDDPPASAEDCIGFLRTKRTEYELPDAEVVKVVWTCLMESINLVGKNPQQILQSVRQKIKSYAALLKECASTARLEAALLVAVQVGCYEENKLMKLFRDIVRDLYDADVVEEDAIVFWYKKGSSPKGRNVFLKDAEPLIKWLEEADEDEEEDDEDEDEE